MRACVILHDMVIEDEGDMFNAPLNSDEMDGTSVIFPPEVTIGVTPAFSDVLRRNATTRARSTHIQLKKDLVENIWRKFRRG